MELIRTSHFRSMYLGWTRAMSVNICVGAAGLGSGVAVFIFFNLIFFSIPCHLLLGKVWSGTIKKPQSLVNVGFPVLDYESSRKVYFGEGDGESF